MSTVSNRLIPVVALASLLAAGAASAQTCQTISEKEVASLFDRWNDSLKTLDPAGLMTTWSNPLRLKSCWPASRR